ncbi:MAG: molybdopterin-dependent oxidoreductase [Deltaproteobacteria bacterium]|nr:molybdopterin-dependent oxidoreductase [Deltaproteobacteria bacterium]
MSKVTRRQFLKVSGAAAAGVAIGSRDSVKAMELERGERAYNYGRIAQLREPYYSVTPYGKLKSPVEVFVENEETVVQVAGHPAHIASRGRSKALDLVSHYELTDPDRIKFPLKRTGKRGEGYFKKISWEEALKEIAKNVNESLNENGPDSIALVRGEDVGGGEFRRFMHTLGSTSIFEMAGDANKKTGQKLTWGADIEVPDFSKSKYILNFGSNIYETFEPHAQTLIDGRIDNHAKLVTFDPRMSMTAGKSDEWIPLTPGTDGLVALAMANVIMSEGLADEDFINEWTNITAEKLAAHLEKFTPEKAEEESGISADTISRLAIEFAKAKPATVFSYRGASSHSNGVYTERAIMLLPIITGNVEVEGGYCLPRRVNWNDIQPVPPVPKGSVVKNGSTFPYLVSSKGLKTGVLFNYNSNPAYSASAAPYWRQTLKDETLLPFTVAIAPFMSETAALCDIVLPEALYLERFEPVTSPSSLMPWVGVRTPLQEAPEEVLDLPSILRDIIDVLDPEEERGYKEFWQFEDTEELMPAYFEGVKEMKEDGGYDAMADYAIWPVYGAVNTETGKFENDDGEAVEAEFGAHEENGFKTDSGKIEIESTLLEKAGYEALPTWVKPANLEADEDSDDEGLTFITYKTAYQAGSATANNKYLSEKSHNNYCMINKETASELNIKDGALARLSTPVGYIITKMRVTNAICPGVVAMAASCGHWSIGPVATAEPHRITSWNKVYDPDVHYNLWWRDNGISVNEIFPLFIDPVSGNASLSFKVKVEPAGSRDKHGDVRTDVTGHDKFFKAATEMLKDRS